MGRDVTFTMDESPRGVGMLVENQNYKDTFRVARIYKEFPWLSRYMSQHELREASVCRLNRRIMEKLPNDELMERIILVDGDGRKITQVGDLGFWEGLLWFFGCCFASGYGIGSPSPRNMGDAIQRIGVRRSDDIKFAVSICSDNVGGTIYTLAVYKMPKQFPTMSLWRAELERVADNAVRQQIAVTDEVLV